MKTKRIIYDFWNRWEWLMADGGCMGGWEWCAVIWKDEVCEVEGGSMESKSRAVRSESEQTEAH